MQEKIIKLINKLENILIKDKRFENDAYFKSKIIKINENKDSEDQVPFDITGLINLAKLSTGPTKETLYLNNNNIDLSKQINNFKEINKNIISLSNIIDLYIS